jgi:hypothetical protein
LACSATATETKLDVERVAAVMRNLSEVASRPRQGAPGHGRVVESVVMRFTPEGPEAEVPR